MEVLEKISEVKSYVHQLREQGKSIGFVPTMGALHQGHISLVERAVKENDIVICSIFVNPIQFNNPEDLKKYPRTIEKDLEMLIAAGCTKVFMPGVEEMYPEKINKEYDFGLMGEVMEAEFRPGHFNGVAIVVNLLFTITQPHRAYFGEKDFQQLAVIRKMVEMDQLDVEIIPCAIMREDNGLAMSSRNMRLSSEQRDIASLIFRIIQSVKEMALNHNPDQVQQWAINEFEISQGIELEYFKIVNTYTLESFGLWKDVESCTACVAAYVGGVRLIDNMKIF
ncbi:MAG: pantoate--beta-alanine ligase [Bacteroidales bacterium]|nr:pantoate--beta-alanine ligase [Bacteroidales bacterium]